MDLPRALQVIGSGVDYRFDVELYPQRPLFSFSQILLRFLCNTLRCESGLTKRPPRELFGSFWALNSPMFKSNVKILTASRLSKQLEDILANKEEDTICNREEQ